MMTIPYELPTVFATPILIPGFMLKIRLQVKEHFNLLQFLLRDTGIITLPKHMLSIVPKIDFEMVEEKGAIYDVYGTVGLVEKVIKIGSVPEEFYVVVRGICRLKLKETISKIPFRINRIETIANYTDLIVDGFDNAELRAEFEKVFTEWMAYYEASALDPFINANPKNILKDFNLGDNVDVCLRQIIPLTQGITYYILRAKSLNAVIRIIIEVLKHDHSTLIHKGASFVKSSNTVTPAVLNSIIGTIGMKRINIKRTLPAELQAIESKIKEEDMPKSVYDFVMAEFNRLKAISSNNPDYPVIINYINYVVNLPWNMSTEESLDLAKAKLVLEANHYGIDKVKTRILQFIAVRILNPQITSPILCFIGPPGVGKTTVAKAIAESLNRRLQRISLGGINHYSDIKGHRKTYIGSMPGCIIQALGQAQTKNPVILLDEIDKMYKGSCGDPAAALLEVLDPEQNATFVDSYINLPFDLSNVMFISTANIASDIPQTLRDRMEIVYLGGYTSEEKLKIAENYLIPKVFKDHGMSNVKVNFTANTIKDIILKYTHEAGVRDLQRKIGAICRYIAVKIVENTNAEQNIYEITPELLLEIFNDEKIYDLKNVLVEKSSNKVGVAIGLSWTPMGGKVQVIETSKVKAKSVNNQLVITGLAGQTLKESIKIAINWIQSFDKKNVFNINDLNVHVHLPGGGIKKDGPSAGITIVCSIVSLIWNTPLRPMIAMTGEISLKGYVLPVGGIKEKILAAYDANIRTVIIPAQNMNAITGLPKNVRDDLNIVPVKHLKGVLELVFPGGLEYLNNCTKDKKIPLSKL